MPQMAPMWWTTLFMLFIITYIMNMILMYFYTEYFITKTSTKKISNKNITWKW
uniref:ATP synthase complex subunit 8 n=1 Tax=Trigonotylus caelestialium TaxID=881767 RepID=A0A0F6MY32_9HEMI|nr:ATP synthase F0 subunit 8 [Trigonotylus caelestialium]